MESDARLIRDSHRFVPPAVLTLILSAALAGCAGQNSRYPPVPQADRDVTVQDAYVYKISPGDQVNIFMWGLEELSGTVPVRPDGMLTTPLVEDIPASGKTPSELARALEAAYAPFVLTPIVSVIVEGFVGLPSQQVRVVGAAAEPAAVPFRKHMTLLDLIIAVGGLTEFAAGNKAVLVRYQDGRQREYSVRLDDLIQDGDISANVSLLPGDVLIIPEAWF